MRYYIVLKSHGLWSGYVADSIPDLCSMRPYMQVIAVYDTENKPIALVEYWQLATQYWEI